MRRSWDNIERYAARLGAGWLAILGKPWDARMTAYSQKLHMLAPEWDAYDTVVMIDSDMFARPCAPDIFAETGIGWHHPTAHARVRRLQPRLTTDAAPFWGGAIYRLDRETRQRLRAEYDYEEAKHFDSYGAGVDEGIMHRLADRARIPTDGAYIDERWCWSSYKPDVERGWIVHVRAKPSKDKLENYLALRQAGIIE